MLITTYPPDHPYVDVINQSLASFSRSWGFMVLSKYEGNGFPVTRVPFRDNLVLLVDLRDRRMYVIKEGEMNRSAFMGAALLIEAGIHEAVDPELIMEAQQEG